MKPHRIYAYLENLIAYAHIRMKPHMRNPHGHWPALIQIVQNQTIDYTTLLNAPKSCKMINCVARGEMECRLRSGLLT